MTRAPGFPVEPEVQRYLRSLGAVPALTREEEMALWYRWKVHGQQSAYDQLIRANLRHVVPIAMKYRGYGLRVTDLVSEGNLGIVCAMHGFDPERGYRFLTYAAYWIRAQILRYVLCSWSLVKTESGSLRSRMFFQLRRERARVHALLGEGATAHEILASRLGIPLTQLQELECRLMSRDVSLDMENAHEGGRSLGDTLACPQSTQEEVYLEHEIQRVKGKLLRAAIGRLDRRERFVLESCLMCDDEDSISLAEVGRRLGVSRERTRQLRTRALRKIGFKLASTAAADEFGWNVSSARAVE